MQRSAVFVVKLTITAGLGAEHPCEHSALKSFVQLTMKKKPQKISAVQLITMPFRVIGVVVKAPFVLLSAVNGWVDRLCADNKVASAPDDRCPQFGQLPMKSSMALTGSSWPPVPEPAKAYSVKEIFDSNATLIRKICYASKLFNRQNVQKRRYGLRSHLH